MKIKKTHSKLDSAFASPAKVRAFRFVHHRSLAVLLSVLLPTLVALNTVSAAPAGPVTFHVNMGYENVAQGAEFEAFLPNNLTVDAGDTVVFTLRTHEPHTITFDAPQPLPDPFLPQPDRNLAANPVLFFPVPLQAGPPPNPEAPVYLSVSFDGTGYVNSGFLQHPGDTLSVTFTRPGTYQALCLLHPEHMKATITVNPAGTPRPKSDEDYSAEAQVQAQDFIVKEEAMLASIKVPDPVTNPNGSRTYTVYAGYGSAEQGIDFMSFIGGEHLALKAGDSVSFIMNKNTLGVPHTITFLSGGEELDFVIPQPQPSGPPKVIVNPKVLMPSPLPPVPYEGKGYYNSGLLLTGGPSPQSYTVTFTKAGNFEYQCILHDEDGMKGTISVLP
jgi:plastocyanin